MASGSSFSSSDQSLSEKQAREDTIRRIANEYLERLQGRLRSCRFTDLHFFPEYNPPTNLKLPKLDIYDGLECPVSHIFTYTSDLVQVGATEEALIRLFYKSLQGPALEWLLTIDHGFSASWVDWARLFIDRYYHNVDASADREWQRHASTNFEDLCFFPEFRLSQHFQVPKLSKYTGQGCPVFHLFVYYRDLRFLGADDETLVRLFYKSLAGPALAWFLSLDRCFPIPWIDLSQLFVWRYHYNMEARVESWGRFVSSFATEFEKLCPFSELRLPKMKFPKFQKYDGLEGCPITHLFVYRQQIRQLGVDDDEKLVSLFYKSLSGVALGWLVSIDHQFSSSWKCLSQLFIERFRFNSDASMVAKWNRIPYGDFRFLLNFQLPDKLDALEFSKYDGNGCPITHMFAYCEDLRQLGASDEALLFLFYKSLAGTVLTWFVSVADHSLTSWECLVELFMDRYSFNSDTNLRQKRDATRPADMRLFPNFLLSDQFKVPRFERYNGLGCPVAHLFAYCQELRQQGEDEKVLTCLFYKSLSGPALTWFVCVDEFGRNSWEALSQIFISRYSYGIDASLMEKQYAARYEDWCFFPDFRLSNDFKVPKFEKYCGKGCPIDHLSVYRRELYGLGLDEETIVCLFHKSLTGGAFRWFVSQDHCSLKSWEKLSVVFSCSYCTLISDNPEKVDLMSLRQGYDESFSDYVYRWRLSAARILDKRNLEEQIKMVKQSAQPGISGYLMPFHFTDFPKLIQMGSRIENGIKNEIIDPWPSSSSATKENCDEKKDGEEEENAATPSASKNSSPPPPFSHQSSPIVLQRTQAGSRMPHKGFIPIEQSYSSILALLLEKGLLTPLQPTPLNPQSKSYDPNAYCEYHQVPGHSTENCFKLKHAVQDLIDKGKIVIAPPTTSKKHFEKSQA